MNWDNLLDESSIAALLPIDYAHFAQPVCDGLAVFLSGLPHSRQAQLVAEQASLGVTASVSERLGLLARSCPVLHKIGQILARDQRLAAELRQQLRGLESLPPSVPWETVAKILENELGSLEQLGITLTPPALAEASVAVVAPFRRQHGRETQHGVFKILKPGIEELLESELRLLESVGLHLDQRCDELGIPHLDYQDAFRQVREKLLEEICLEHEQRNLVTAARFYAEERRVQIPAIYDCCTPRVTAMQRVWGDKVTSHPLANSRDRRQLAKLIVGAMIAQPIFSQQNHALFHCDPHAGNLFLTRDGRLAILDWSLVGWLREQDRIAIVQIMLGVVAQDRGRVVAAISDMGESGTVNNWRLQQIVANWFRKVRHGQFPGLFWLVGMLDDAVRDAQLRLKPDFMMFRKSLFTLEGVVAEVGGSAATFDQVLSLQFLQTLAMEWPSRWLVAPSSRKFATRLSNFDLTQAILSCPSSLAQFWMDQGFDWFDACRCNANRMLNTSSSSGR